MKIRVDSTTFAEAAVFAAKAISPRPATPILAGLLIEAIEGTVRLSGFDYEVSNRITAQAEVLDAGNVLVPGRMLTNILSKLPKNRPVELTVDGNRVSIVSGKAKYTMATMPAADFPAMPALPEKVGSVDGNAFAESVAQVAKFACKDDQPANLTPVRVTTSGATMTFEATDRYRMAQKVIPWNPVGDGEHLWLVRPKTLESATRTGAGEMIILATEDLIGFRSGNRVSTSLLVDENYPDISKLFPQTTEIDVTTNRAQLADTIGRISTVIEGKQAMRFNVTETEIEMDAGAGDDATGREFVDCEALGGTITAGFNPHYFSEALDAVPGENITIGFQDNPGKPVVITAASDDVVNYKHILMPIGLKG